MAAALVHAPHKVVTSDAQLRHQLEVIRDGLDLNHDWNKRVNHLVSLEGLLAGGAPRLACFAEELRRLLEPLSEQLLDRSASSTPPHSDQQLLKAAVCAVPHLSLS